MVRVGYLRTGWIRKEMWEGGRINQCCTWALRSQEQVEGRGGQGEAAPGPHRETGCQEAQVQNPCPTYGCVALAFWIPFPSLIFLVCKMQILTFASGGDAAMKLNEMKHKKVPSSALGTNHEYGLRKMLFPVACQRIYIHSALPVL